MPVIENHSRLLSAKENCNGDTVGSDEDNQFSLCVLCGKTFTTISSLHQHIDSMHADAIREEESISLQQTSTLETSDKPTVSFQSLEECRKGNNYCCPVCKRHFPGAISLKVHIDTIHHGQKSAECDVCKKRFSTLSYLRLHTSTVHEGLRAYHCSICCKSYTQKHSLKKHMKSAHPESMCGKSEQSISTPGKSFRKLPSVSSTSRVLEDPLGALEHLTDPFVTKSLAFNSLTTGIARISPSFDVAIPNGRSHIHTPPPLDLAIVNERES